MTQAFNPPSHPILDRWHADVLKLMERTIHPWIKLRIGIWACYDVLRGCKLPEVWATVDEFLAERKPGPELEQLRQDIAKAKAGQYPAPQLNPTADLGLF